MSERIKELREHATTRMVGENNTPYDVLDVEKFAGLIVRECADYVQHFYGDFAAKSIGAGMRKHFGVE